VGKCKILTSNGEVNGSVFSKYCEVCSTTHYISYSSKFKSNVRAFRCDCLSQDYFCPSGRIVWETTYLRAVTSRLYRGASFHSEWASWSDTFPDSVGVDDHTFANHWFVWALVNLTLSLNPKRRGCVFNIAGPVLNHPTATSALNEAIIATTPELKRRFTRRWGLDHVQDCKIPGRGKVYRVCRSHADN
jgi:hypothetical protein